MNDHIRLIPQCLPHDVCDLFLHVVGCSEPPRVRDGEVKINMLAVPIGMGGVRWLAGEPNGVESDAGGGSPLPSTDRRQA